jgi:4-oxalocrotonate tautomerase
MKRALYAEIAARLHADPGMRKEDVFIVLTETKAENWSFGNGIAQLASLHAAQMGP